MRYFMSWRENFYLLVRNKRRELRKQGRGWREGKSLEFLTLHSKTLKDFLDLVRLHDSQSNWKWAITIKNLINSAKYEKKIKEN